MDVCRHGVIFVRIGDWGHGTASVWGRALLGHLSIGAADRVFGEPTPLSNLFCSQEPSTRSSRSSHSMLMTGFVKVRLKKAGEYGLIKRRAKKSDLSFL